LEKQFTMAQRFDRIFKQNYSQLFIEKKQNTTPFSDQWPLIQLGLIAKGCSFLLLFLFCADSLSAQPWLKSKKIIRASAPTPATPVREGFLIPPSGCQDALNYTPDPKHPEHTPMRLVRVNVHFVNTTSGKYNYQGDAGIAFAQDLIREANKNLADNKHVWLPHGNSIPVLPTRYQLVLFSQANRPNDKGVYFHADDECAFYVHKGRDENLFDHRVVDRYAVGKDSIINLFIMPHNPDSMRSPHYSRTANGVGVMIYDAIKMAGIFETKWPASSYKGIFNHELGHFFGLQHAWYYDNCDDTPDHDNPCWDWTPNAPCDLLASNNVMDNNAQQNAWTPCQIGQIHFRMSTESNVERQYLVHNWCTLQPGQDIVITDTVAWKGAKDLLGNITIAPGGQLTIACRVSLPEGARITVQPGAKLILDQARLHNACGKQWEGIETPGSLFQKKGQVIFQGEVKIEHARRLN
jgi:hypothetical protein